MELANYQSKLIVHQTPAELFSGHFPETSELKEHLAVDLQSQMCSAWMLVNFKPVHFIEGQECQEHHAHWYCLILNKRKKNTH